MDQFNLPAVAGLVLDHQAMGESPLKMTKGKHQHANHDNQGILARRTLRSGFGWIGSIGIGNVFVHSDHRSMYIYASPRVFVGLPKQQCLDGCPSSSRERRLASRLFLAFSGGGGRSVDQRCSDVENSLGQVARPRATYGERTEGRSLGRLFHGMNARVKNIYRQFIYSA